MTSSTSPRTAPATAADHLEQTAAQEAERNKRTKTSDEDREQAYEEMMATSPPVSPEEDASH